MIIKGKSRARALDLARHLLRTDSNETVRLFEARGTVARDVEGALREMEAYGLTAHSGKPLYHASISPEAHLPLNDAQIRIAADTLETKLGLAGQARLIVLHRKEGREHVHVVWSRIDAVRGLAIRDSWNYRLHEEAARELEAAFGQPVVPGAHTPDRRRKRGRTLREYEYRQAERSGRQPAKIAAELTALWETSKDAQSFRRRLQEEGYTLARGDRRVFVVIDRDGNAHSLGRRLGLRADELRDQLRGLDMNALPSVADARTAQRDGFRRADANAAYRAAATEMTGRATEIAKSRPVARVVPRCKAARFAPEQIAWVNSVYDRPGPIMRRTAPRFPVRASKRYHSERALIVADFASKLADAFRRSRGDELEALLGRLMAEREAALRKLAEERQDARQQPPRCRALRHRIFRHRTVRKRRRFIVRQRMQFL